MSQKQMILDYLKQKRHLTPLEALKKFGCFRLAARIEELRDAGYRIHTTMIDVAPDKRVAAYLLIHSRKRAA
jgi:hypothetical protein